MAEDKLYYRVMVTAGDAAYDLSEDLSSFTIEQRELEPDLLAIEMSDPFKVLGHALQEGMEIETELGTAEDHSIVFRGRIYRVEESFPKNGVPTLSLRAFDRSMAMGLRKRNRVFSEMSLSAVVKKIAADYFDDLDVDVRGDLEFGKNGIRQQDETDLAFLRRLAATCGCVMYASATDDGNVFHFIDEHTVMTSEPELTLYYGRSDVDHALESFEASTDVAHIQLPRVLSGIDYETAEPIEVATADVIDLDLVEDPFLDENLSAYRNKDAVRAAQIEELIAAAESIRKELREELGGVERVPIATFTTAKELGRRAENQYSTRLLGMSGKGTTAGEKDLLACTAVEIGDVGGRFSGIWFLSEVRHVLNEDGFTTEFECRR